ncbi:hypothetical protein, partial [Escherichia coli]|uniref:hypothetical protein n=1 Tax=Escherichia coli TaxID=562 RepID=UPI001BE3DA3F
DRNRSHWSTSKTPSYTKSVSWQHHREKIKIKKVALRKVSLTTGTDYFSRRELSISFCNQNVRT